MSYFNGSSPYSPGSENYEFIQKLRKKFDRDDGILFEFIQRFFASEGLESITNTYINLFRKNFLKRGDKVSFSIKSIFLNILRVINPPGKKNPPAVEHYLNLLVSSCVRPDIRKVLEESFTPPSSFLIKTINEKCYEQTNLDLPDLTGSQPLATRRFHYLQVDHQDAAKSKKLFRKELMSMIFEEICLLTIRSEYRGICTIHSPKAGDILLANGETVEVKSNASKIDSISASKCRFGIYSGPKPLRIPPVGIMLGITVLEKKQSRSAHHKTSYQKKYKDIHFDTTHLKNLDEDIQRAVELSGISCPPDMSLKFLDLLFGDMVEVPSIPVLTDCISMPIIEPDFMDTGGSARALGLKLNSSRKKYSKSRRGEKKGSRSKKGKKSKKSKK